jgi:hypothetical protein
MIYQKKSGSAHYFPEEEEKEKKKGEKGGQDQCASLILETLTRPATHLTPVNDPVRQ